MLASARMGLRKNRAPSAPFSDNFNRPDNPVLGNGWTSEGNPLAIVSNAASPVAGPSVVRYDTQSSRALVAPPSTVTVDVLGSAASSGRAIWIMLGTPSTVGVALSIDQVGSWKLWSLPDFTVRASGSDLTGNTQVTLSKVGNVYTAYRSVTPVVSWNDSGALTSPVQPAITLYAENDVGNNPPSFTFDNVSTDVAAT